MSPAATIVTSPAVVTGGVAADVVVAGAAVVVGWSARARGPSERLPSLHDAKSARRRAPTAQVTSTALPGTFPLKALTLPTRSRRPSRVRRQTRRVGGLVEVTCDARGSVVPLPRSPAETRSCL